MNKFWCETTRSVTCPLCGTIYHGKSAATASVIAATGCGCDDDGSAMTFDDHAQLIADEYPYPDEAEAHQQAALDILEGFRDFIGNIDTEEAADFAHTMRRTGGRLYTARGYEIDFACLEAAIKYYEEA